MDGFLEVTTQKCILKNDENKVVTIRMMQCSGHTFAVDDTIEVGNYEAVLQKEISVEDYRSGKPFMAVAYGTQNAAAISTLTPGPAKTNSKVVPTSFKPPMQSKTNGALSARPPSSSAHSTSALSPSILPLCGANLAATAFLLNVVDPSDDKSEVIPGEVPVAVDPTLAKHLRPHQREGVRFLYRCVMGLQLPGYSGCILADEMGLGKTLQTIALLYTLLRSSPQGASRPACRKAVVVCPSTLTRNWQKEFKKWLGSHKLSVVVLGADTPRSASKADPDDDADEAKSVGSAYQKALREEIAMFISSALHQVLIISYEMFRKHAEALSQLPSTTLIVCDEGHRLKNVGGNKTVQAFASIPSRRRIILSGTPVQNDLMEFYAMVEFVNPGILGSVAKFKNSFEGPITRSRDGSSTPKERELGALRSAELTRLTSAFILRRTNALLTQYLPPKYEFAVFVPMTTFQQVVYQGILASRSLNRVLSLGSTTGSSSRGPSALALRLITLLKKAANHPLLVFQSQLVESSEEEGSDQLDLSSLDGIFPPDYAPLTSKLANSSEVAKSFSYTHQLPLDPVIEHRVKESSKLAFLVSMLESVADRNVARVNEIVESLNSSSARETTIDLEKVVVVSNYQETLNVIEAVLSNRGWSSLRMDGSTPQHQRQLMVDQFNAPLQIPSALGAESVFARVAQAPCIFLLSSQAGGIGLNLTGANRLVLFEPNWNPAFDLQAMSRIWRDGQTRVCYIYRLFSAATIDEKIYQRQMRKGDLALSILDDEKDGNSNAIGEDPSRLRLSTKELKALFTYTESPCSTFQTLSAQARDGLAQSKLSRKSNESSASDANLEEKLTWRLTAAHEFFAPEDVISKLPHPECMLVRPLNKIPDAFLSRQLEVQARDTDDIPKVSFVFRSLSEKERAVKRAQLIQITSVALQSNGSETGSEDQFESASDDEEVNGSDENSLSDGGVFDNASADWYKNEKDANPMLDRESNHGGVPSTNIPEADSTVKPLTKKVRRDTSLVEDDEAAIDDEWNDLELHLSKTRN